MTATLVDATATPYAVASGTTTVGITALAARIATLWNAKYGTAGTSSTLSVWGNMTATAGAIALAHKASSQGSRGSGDVITVAWAKATAAQVSNVTAGTMSTAATYLAGHSMDWKLEQLKLQLIMLLLVQTSLLHYWKELMQSMLQLVKLHLHTRQLVE